MSIGEQLFLGLVLLAFSTFGITLGLVSWRTNRHMRRRAADQPAGRNPSLLNKAA